MNIRQQLSGVSAAVLTALALVPAVHADQTTRVQGIHQHTPSLIALQNATIITEPGKRFENATLVIEHGKVRAINANNQAPEGARVIDVTGHIIYPGFIDAYSSYGVPKPEQGLRGYRTEPPQYSNEREGGNAANDAIHAQLRWIDSFSPDQSAAKGLIEQGFTAVQTARLDGIFQGQAAVVSLADKIANELVYNPSSLQFGSFDKGSSRQQYPSSLMGSIALVRQTLSDAAWYEQARGKTAISGEPVEYNAALDALTTIEQQGMLFAAEDELSLLRADQVLDEYNVRSVFLGSGFEYARVEAVKNTGSALILPLDFPAAPDVAGVDAELDVELADLRHWERAPSNPATLAQAGVDFALTTAQLEKPQAFWPNLRKAIQHGLSQQQALAALTTIPAQIAGVSDKVGKLQPGYMADFVIAKGDLFTDGEIAAVWLQGEAVELKPLQPAQLSGEFELNIANQALQLTLEADSKVSGSIKQGDTSHSLRNATRMQDQVEFVVDLDIAGLSGAWRVRLEQTAAARLQGVAVGPDGRELPLQATRVDAATAAEVADEETSPTYVSQLTFPNVAYGQPGLPQRENIHIKNATVWTADEQGILTNADIIIRDGEFDEIGQDLDTPRGFTVIDAEGKHVTPGIIDEHSHIAISQGVNEGSEAITAEVHIGDVVNPDDIHIYRSLAGGTTMAQLLHGSANPIGGRAQVIKLRWGADAELMKFDAAPDSIKFALGENVKQSNWGDDYTVRYPQTRMGVETIMRDGFIAAREYAEAKAAYDDLSRSERARTAPPRPDERLDVLLEILRSERFVHAHSYVQSEILMLLRLAEEFDFTITAFTHILEGYKVASEMAKHGAGGSTFADWWGFKFEVYDAIPFNACLMMEKGVLTSVNSDSNDLQRRLNTEAGKSVRYCDMDPHEALKMITINPAKQLKVEQYVGSITEGKHADFVIWNNNPLSAYARVEQTWINARKFFDYEADLERRQAVVAEKQQLIQKVLAAGDAAKQGAANGYKPKQPTWHCEDQHDVWLDEFMVHTHGGRH